MSVMSNIATELEVSWHPLGQCFWRELPNRQHAIIVETESSCALYVDGREIWTGDDISGAIVAAGSLAREQLKRMMLEWSAPWGSR